MSGLEEAARRLRRLAHASWLTKEERDALKYALVILEDVEQTFYSEELTLPEG